MPGETSFLSNQQQTQQELQQQIKAVAVGAVQLWENYTAIAADCTPEMLRQLTNQIVQNLNQYHQQIKQQQQGGQQQFGTRSQL